MSPQELNDLATKSANEQIDLQHKLVENHLDESDRIAARQVTEALSRSALDLISDPTS